MPTVEERLATLEKGAMDFDERMKNFWDALNALTERMGGLATQVSNLMLLINQKHTEAQCFQTKVVEDHEKRLRSLEDWRNTVFGGGKVLIFIVSGSSLLTIGTIIYALWWLGRHTISK